MRVRVVKYFVVAYLENITVCAAPIENIEKNQPIETTRSARSLAIIATCMYLSM